MENVTAREFFLLSEHERRCYQLRVLMVHRIMYKLNGLEFCQIVQTYVFKRRFPFSLALPSSWLLNFAINRGGARGGGGGAGVWILRAPTLNSYKFHFLIIELTHQILWRSEIYLEVTWSGRSVNTKPNFERQVFQK